LSATIAKKVNRLTDINNILKLMLHHKFLI